MKNVEHCCDRERNRVPMFDCDGNQHSSSAREIHRSSTVVQLSSEPVVLTTLRQLVISVGALREHEHVHTCARIYPNDSARKPSARPRRHTRLLRVTLESAQRQLPQLLQERCGQIIDGMHERESDTSET
jgi:hypothetical protein